MDFGSPKKFTVEFNCLGLETRTRLLVHIDIPLRSPVVLAIDKECSKETLIDRLAETIVSNEKTFGAFKVAALVSVIGGIVYMVVTCNNLCKGKSLRQSIPCGGCLYDCCFGKARTPGEELPSKDQITEPSVTSSLMHRKCRVIL